MHNRGDTFPALTVRCLRSGPSRMRFQTAPHADAGTDPARAPALNLWAAQGAQGGSERAPRKRQCLPGVPGHHPTAHASCCQRERLGTLLLLRRGTADSDWTTPQRQLPRALSSQSQRPAEYVAQQRKWQHCQRVPRSCRGKGAHGAAARTYKQRQRRQSLSGGDQR
jgi:hypothetical protein